MEVAQVQTHAPLPPPCRLTVISSRTVRWTAVSMNIWNHGNSIWQSLCVTAPWLKGWLAGWALQAGVCWREVLESSALQILPKQLPAKDGNNHSAQNKHVVAKVRFQSFKTMLKWFPGVRLAECTGLSSCKRKGCEGGIWQYPWLIMMAMMIIFSGLLNDASKHSQREKKRILDIF